jgi:serine/threonine protein kinase
VFVCSLGSLGHVLQTLRASGSGIGIEEGVVSLVLLHMCLALAALHDNDIIHRDIKAGNILVTHLLDFKVRDLALVQISLRGVVC